jgi:hypothetical protein
MDNLIDLRAAADLDRKYFVAFLKGLTSMKYAFQFAKMASENGEDAPEVMDLDFLYSNLFNQEMTSADSFNKLVENGLKLIKDLLEQNLARDKIEEYLQRRVRASEDSRKAVMQFWKQESGNLISAIRCGLQSTKNQGLTDIDWEI